MSKSKDILPERTGENDNERRLREAINRHSSSLMATLDAAIALRSAPSEAQRARHMARGHLLDFSLKALHALNLTEGSK